LSDAKRCCCVDELNGGPDKKAGEDGGKNAITFWALIIRM
jgi:hypothetical protein